MTEVVQSSLFSLPERLRLIFDFRQDSMLPIVDRIEEEFDSEIRMTGVGTVRTNGYELTTRGCLGDAFLGPFIIAMIRDLWPRFILHTVAV